MKGRGEGVEKRKHGMEGAGRRQKQGEAKRRMDRAIKRERQAERERDKERNKANVGEEYNVWLIRH